MSGQAVIMMAGALILILSTMRLVRRRLLSIRYGIGWLLVGFAGAIGAPVLTFVANQINIAGFTPTGFSVGVFIIFLGLVCLQLSVSLSGLHRAIQDLAEHSAHVEARVRQLEGRPAGTGASASNSGANASTSASSSANALEKAAAAVQQASS